MTLSPKGKHEIEKTNTLEDKLWRVRQVSRKRQRATQRSTGNGLVEKENISYIPSLLVDHKVCNENDRNTEFAVK